MIYQCIPLDCPPSSTSVPVYFLDIETSGFDKQKDTIIMIGLLTNLSGAWHYHYWISEDLSEECSLLTESLSHFILPCILHTFGGSVFDLAFIHSRCELLGLSTEWLSQVKHIDFKKLPLFKVICTHTAFSRTHVENFLHYTRSLTSKGKELIKIIKLYISTPLPVYRQLILTHNKEDLLSLMHMWYFYQLIVEIPSALCSEFLCEPFKVSCCLKVSTPFPTDLNVQLGMYYLHYKKEASELVISLTPLQATLKYTLPFKDYYFVNGQLMHKSLADCIPKIYKRKATKEEAYLLQENCYIHSMSKDALWTDASLTSYIPYTPTHYSQLDFFQTLNKTITRGSIK